MRRLVFALALSIIPFSSGTEAIAGSILYVDDDAPSGGKGLSWESPLRYLQDALAIAAKPGSGITEIRIGQGTYKADQGANQTPGDVDASFVVANLALRGGYAGHGAKDPDARDFELYPTILSGDLLGNDGPPGSFENYQDNTRRIVSVVQTSEQSTTLEGLRIRGAAGLPSDGTIHPNIVGGGGLHCVHGEIFTLNCVFELNHAPWGGGAFLSGSKGEVVDCTFVLNQCFGNASAAGGIYGSANVLIRDSQFIGNRASGAGSGGAGSGNFTRCRFEDNSAESHGGAVYVFFATIIDCEFINNSAALEGGAIFGYPTIIGCTFEGNAAYAGGAVYGNVEIRESRFIDNITWGYAGTGFWGSGTIINCEFTANQALNSSAGGAAGACKPTTGLQICGPAEFINCIFNANYSFSVGGGAWIESTQTATFTNCTFVNNVSNGDIGAGISTDNGIAPPGFAIVRNCIVSNNSPGQLNGPMDVQYSLVQGGWPGKGNIASDPLLVDPLGPDGIAGTEDDNLRLSSGSPCIDAGDNTALPFDTLDVDGDGNTNELFPIDFDGEPRRLNDPKTPNTGYPPEAGAIVDLGAFEFGDFESVFADISGNGVVDVDDLLAVIDSWGKCPPGFVGCDADLDQDGMVNQVDLLLVIQNWG